MLAYNRGFAALYGRAKHVILFLQPTAYNLKHSLERVRCRDSGEESAFALERVTEEEVFCDGHVNLQLFFNVDSETEADMVLRQNRHARPGGGKQH